MDHLYINIFFAYFLVISIIAIAVTIYDKRQAKQHKWRVKENNLFIIAALFGGLAMFITMRIIRHKTKEVKFMVGLPVMVVVQIALIYFIIK